FNPNDDKNNGECGGDERGPEHSAHIAGEERHQRDRDQRAGEGAGCVERLAKSIGAAAYLWVASRQPPARRATPHADPCRCESAKRAPKTRSGVAAIAKKGLERAPMP